MLNSYQTMCIQIVNVIVPLEGADAVLLMLCCGLLSSLLKRGLVYFCARSHVEGPPPNDALPFETLLSTSRPCDDLRRACSADARPFPAVSTASCWRSEEVKPP